MFSKRLVAAKSAAKSPGKSPGKAAKKRVWNDYVRGQSGDAARFEAIQSAVNDDEHNGAALLAGLGAVNSGSDGGARSGD